KKPQRLKLLQRQQPEQQPLLQQQRHLPRNKYRPIEPASSMQKTRQFGGFFVCNGFTSSRRLAITYG
ncbi:MAG: hypothetical protein ACXU8A_12405, partial [Burkholderiaceae bacterium]